MCGAALGIDWARARVNPPPAGSGRAVRFAWRLLLATSAGACGARTDVAQTGDLGLDGGGDAALASDAGRDAGRDAGPSVDGGRVDAGDDAGIDAGDIPIYGAPPPDVLPTSHDVLVPPDPIPRRRRRRVAPR